MKNPLRFFLRKSSETRTQAGQTFISRTASAVPVSSEMAMRSSAVYSGVRYLSETVGQLPWWPYKTRRDGRGCDALLTGGFVNVNNVLRFRANPDMSSSRLREILITHAILYGNGVAEIERDGNGRAMALYVLRPEKLTFQYENGRLVFIYDDETRGRLRLQQREVFHIPNFGMKFEMPAVGASVIEYAAESIGWHRATELFGAAYFANGIHPSAIITMKNALSPEAYKLFTETLERKFSGSDGAHKAFVTDGEASIQKLSVQPDDSQFIESLNYQIDEIARWIGVPPSKIGHLIHAGVRANVEQEAISVIQDHVMPWVQRFESEANAKLFRENEQYFTKMDLSSLLRGDNLSRSTFYREMLVNGVFSVNEVREMEDMNPIGPEGDQHLVQGQYLPLSQAGKQLKPKEIGTDDETDEQAGSGAAISPDARSIPDNEEWGGVRRTLHL